MMDQDKIAKTSDKVRTLLIYEKMHDYICLECLKISSFDSQRVFGDAENGDTTE